MQLIEIAQIFPGYPFRGRIHPVESGGVPVLQLKDCSPGEGINWSGAVRAKLTGKRKPEWLRDEDVLFAAKGYHNWAVLVSGAPDQSVCSPLYFHLRVSRLDLVRPDFLAWFINQERAQAYLATGAMGSGTPNIRRDVLEKMEVKLPPLDQQSKLMALYDSLLEHGRALLSIQRSWEIEFGALADDVLARSSSL